MESERISRQEVQRKLEAGEKVEFIDARSAEAWRESEVQIPGSIRVVTFFTVPIVLNEKA